MGEDAGKYSLVSMLNGSHQIPLGYGNRWLLEIAID